MTFTSANNGMVFGKKRALTCSTVPRTPAKRGPQTRDKKKKKVKKKKNSRCTLVIIRLVVSRQTETQRQQGERATTKEESGAVQAALR